jgi:hypothetical protein
MTTRSPKTKKRGKTAPGIGKPVKRRSSRSNPKAKRASGKTAGAATASSESAGAERGASEAPPAVAEDLPPAASRIANTSPQRRLDTILRALPDAELAALIKRMGIRIDKKKRIDAPAQIARALARLPDLREPTRLPPVSAELVRRIAEANGTMSVTALPAGLEQLVRRGMVYARVADSSVELMLPTAMLVQMKSWEGEDPRSLRALLSEAPFETASAIATHYLGRPSTPPIALSLEPAWEVLGNPLALRAELERVSHQERRLLDQLEQVGGEVETQELMDLEREPMRVRGAYGVAAGRRGAAFSLEKRGLLFPLHPNRYVIPTEVAALIGTERRKEREKQREEIRSHVVEEDHLPRRARFSSDPAPLALAMTLALSEAGTDVKPGVGTPRSLVSRLAHRFGRDVETTALVVALSRAIGLWERGGVSVAAPPGSLDVAGLSTLLFSTWRRGGAWDEARPDSEMLRLPPEQRDPSPMGVLRQMVIDALRDLGEGQWVPYNALIRYVGNDPRAGGLERLLARWAKRTGMKEPSRADLAQRILLESLPTLGVVDVGGADMDTASGSGELKTLALRLTKRGRELLTQEDWLSAGELDDEAQPEQEFQHTPSSFVDQRTLRVGSNARVAHVLELGAFSDLVALESVLELSISASAVARGLSAGIEAAEMRARIQTLTPLSEELTMALTQAGTIVGRGSMTGASAFVWIDDPDVREMLRSMQAVAELFVDPSPPTGLLVAPGVDPERVVRRCRALGVDITVEDNALYARHNSQPPPKVSESRKSVSWRPPAARARKRSSAKTRRPSSAKSSKSGAGK